MAHRRARRLVSFMRIDFHLRQRGPIDDACTIARFQNANVKPFPRARKTASLTACMLILLAWSTRSDAQRISRAGISDSAARRRPLVYVQPDHLSRDAVDSIRVASADGTPRGAIGAAFGAVVGGILGYRWYRGLCEAPASECTGKPGAIGGAVVGAAVGFVLGWAISGLHDSASPRSVRDTNTSAETVRLE